MNKLEVSWCGKFIKRDPGLLSSYACLFDLSEEHSLSIWLLLNYTIATSLLIYQNELQYESKNWHTKII